MLNASVICMNPLAISKDANLIINHGINKLHFDIMDSQYVRRFGLYPEIHRELAKNFNFSTDCHFMVEDVAKGIKEWCSYIVPDKVSFHYKDNKSNLQYLVEMAQDYGSDPILAVDIDVTVEELIGVLRMCKPTGLMFLSIIPGVLKQMHKPDLVFDKIRRLKQFGYLSNMKYIQVDGGVNFETAPHLIKAGANELICGSSTIFKHDPYLNEQARNNKIVENINHLQSII